MRRALAGLLVSALAAGPAAAAPPADPWESPAYQACMKTAATTAAMGACNSAELGRRDAELNSAYSQLIGALKIPERTAPMRKAQRAWISYRDAQCEAEGAEALGGTLASLIIGSCRIGLTYERTLKLQAMLRSERAQ
jgi:uncharacterized protein YecT (DUF1311 family)